MSYNDDKIRDLADIALHYAKLAVEADRKGLKSLAVTYYSKAVDALTELLNYEESPTLRQLYTKKIREYRYRMTFLRGVISGKIQESKPYKSNGKPVIEHKHEEPVLKKFKSSITWDDIIGLDHVKKLIRQSIVYPIRRPDLFPLGWPRGILLYGPPGCGKTSVAAAVSNEIDAEFYPVDAPMIMSKWLGESEKKVAQVFSFVKERARNNIPVILFIDEVDSLIGIRSNEVGGEVRVRNQFLKEMDGLEDKDNFKLPLFVVASTNKPWLLDLGFIRRFQKRIYIPPPDRETRKKLFRYFLSKVNVNSDIDHDLLAEYTKGYTPSDIKDVCQMAIIEVVSELFESGLASDPSARPRPITIDDLVNAIKRVKPSITSEMLIVYNNWYKKFRSE